MKPYHLFMLVVGCKPAGRFTEQHDIFFGIARQMKELIPQLLAFWPEAKGKIHIDSWRCVKQVDGYIVELVQKNNRLPLTDSGEVKLFFINLGGYKQDDAEEYHYKLLVAAPDKVIATQKAKQTAFYKHTGFEGAVSHIDDRYGIDVDDLYEIEDILPAEIKEKFSIVLKPAPGATADPVYPGYITLEKLALHDEQT